MVLTLGADHDDRDVRAVCTQLAVELVELLEAALVLQTENQNHRVHPAAELKEKEDKGGRGYTMVLHTNSLSVAHTHLGIRWSIFLPDQ